MPTVQQLLDTINTTYRNSYSTSQKIEWMDTVQRQIFQLVRHEAIPYNFVTVSDFAYYSLPGDCDPMGIKQITIETGVGTGSYRDLRFVSVESNEHVDSSTEFYSVEANQNLFINPLPNADTAGRNVYMYYNKRPAALSSANLSATPDLEADFHELLIIGTIERIARARGEVDDKNMFAADFNILLRDYKNMYKQVYPEYTRPRDVMPKRRGHISIKNRRGIPSGWIPDVQ